MKVQMLWSLSGTRNGKDWPGAGDTLTVPDDEGKHLIAAGLATLPTTKGKASAGVEEQDGLLTERADTGTWRCVECGSTDADCGQWHE